MLLSVASLKFSVIKNDLVESVELFLMKFSKIRGARKFKAAEI